MSTEVLPAISPMARTNGKIPFAFWRKSQAIAVVFFFGQRLEHAFGLDGPLQRADEGLAHAHQAHLFQGWRLHFDDHCGLEHLPAIVDDAGARLAVI